MIEKLVNEISFEAFKDDLSLLLEQEININRKKINKEPLTIQEIIFDSYFIKPSSILRLLLNRNKK